MSDSPTHDPIPEMLEAAWAQVSSELMDDERRWKAAIESPISKSSTPAAVNAASHVAEEALALLLRAALEFHVRLAFAQKQGLTTPPLLAGSVQATAAFATALARDDKLYCGSPACDWAGSPGQAGPTGKCPKCASQCRVKPNQSILGPTGAVLRA